MIESGTVNKKIKVYILKMIEHDEIILGYTTCRDLNISFEPEITKTEFGFSMSASTSRTVLKSIITNDKIQNIREIPMHLDPDVKQAYQETGTCEKKSGLLRIDQKHKINLIYNRKHVNYRPYRKNKIQREIINGGTQDLLVKGKIRESESGFMSPVVLVQKTGW